jgi:hypothetical protein
VEKLINQILNEDCLEGLNRIPDNYIKEKQIDEDWSFDYLKPSDTNKLTHGYHRYPAKFIPQKANEFVKRDWKI